MQKTTSKLYLDYAYWQIIKSKQVTKYFFFAGAGANFTGHCRFRKCFYVVLDISMVFQKTHLPCVGTENSGWQNNIICVTIWDLKSIPKNLRTLHKVKNAGSTACKINHISIIENWFGWCRSTPAEPADNRCLKKRHLKTQNKTETLHFTLKNTWFYSYLIFHVIDPYHIWWTIIWW